MDKETTTSVTIDRKTFARLDRLAKSNNVSKKEFLSCALEYFEKYGINPVEHESPAKEMQKLIKRCDQVIAFIRKQEQDFLRPACEAMGSTSMRVTMSMDSILTEKKFSQYQKDNDLFMRDLASLAGIREQALDRAEKAVGQSRDMLLKNQQAIYARLDAVTQRQEKIFSYMGLLAHFTQIYHLYNLLIYNILRRNLQLFITEFCIFSPCIIFISNKNSDKSIEILHISPKYITSVDNLMIHIFSSTFNFLYSFTPSDRLESKS